MKTLTSVIAANKTRSCYASLGFSLLEMLLVVFLIAAIAGITLPYLLNENIAQKRVQSANQLAQLMTLASDYSLFRGEMLAVRLSADTIEPLIYDVSSADFVAPADESLGPLILEEGLLLQWQLAEQDGAEQQLSLAAAVEARQQAQKNKQTSASPPSEVEQEVLEPPQLYFFPSGEATPITLIVSHLDEVGEERLEIDAIGQLHRVGSGVNESY